MNTDSPVHLSSPSEGAGKSLLSRLSRIDGWMLVSLLLASALAAPLVAVGLAATQTGPEWGYIVETLLPHYVKNTLILVFGVSLLTLLMAIPPAWLVVIYDFPGRRFFEWLLILPLAFPTYVAALVYLNVPEALIPILVWIRETYGTETFMHSQAILRYGLLIVVFASVLFPYVYLTARASFSLHNRALIEASQMLGRSAPATFFTVALPLSRPAIIAGLSLVVMEVVNDYGAVNLLGVPTLAEGVFRSWFGLEDRASAIRLAGLVTLFVLLLLAFEYLLRGRRKYAETRTEHWPLERIPLSPFPGAGALLACLVPVSLGLLFPLWKLGQWWALTYSPVQVAALTPVLLRTLTLSATAAAMIVALGLLMAFSLRTTPWPGCRSAFRLASLGYAMPGAVVAVGVMILAGWSDRFTSPLFLISGTLGAVAFGYAARFLAVSYQPTNSGMERLCGRLDEASTILGHGRWSTLGRVVLPLMRRPLLASGMLVLVDIFKELPLTMLLRPANFDTLATKAFSLAKEGRIHESAFPSLAIVIVGIALLLPLNRWLRQTGTP